MAGNAIIGALRVVLGADTAQFEKGLKGAQGRVSNFSSGVGKALAVASAAIAAAAGGIGVAIRSTINTMDDLTKEAQRIGVPVDQLSALGHAADLSGVSIESLSKGVGRLARNMVEAEQGLTTPIRAFGALGISVRDSEGNIKSVSDLLPELADKFSKMPDGPVKTALAMQLLGRAGTQLIPMLNAGSSGLKEMMDEARKLGLVFSTETGKQAELFNDNMSRLGAVFRGVIVQVTANILPALARLSQVLIDGAKNSGFLEAATRTLTTAFNGIARVAIIVYDNIGLILKIGALFVGARIGAAAISFGIAFVRLAAAIRATGIVLAVFNTIRSMSTKGLLLIAGIVAMAAGAFDDFSAKIKSVGDAIANMLPEGTGQATADLLKSMGLNLQGLTTDLNNWKGVAGNDGGLGFKPGIINETKNALESFIASTNKRIASMAAEAQGLGKTTYEMERSRITLEAEAIAKQNNLSITGALREKIARLGEAYALMADKIEGRRIWESTRTAAEQFGLTMTDLNGKLQRGAIDADTYARAVAQAQDKLAEANPHARNLGTALESAFDKAFEAGAKFSDILRSLALDLAKMEAKAAFRALLYGNAGGGGTSSGILGTIFSGLKLPGFATGGLIPAGGTGGIDSQVVAFRKSPKEQVAIGTPGQMGGGGGPLTVHVSLDNAMLRAVVTDESGRVVARAQPAIEASAVQRTLREIPRQRAMNPNFFNPG